MALIPKRDFDNTLECFKIDWGFFYGDKGEELLSYLVALDFWVISTGTGFIITLEFFLLDKVGLF